MTPPFLDEATAVGHVIEKVPASLPGAGVHTYDNRSTATVVRAHGAAVRYQSDEASRLVRLQYPSPHGLLDERAPVEPSVDVRRDNVAQR